MTGGTVKTNPQGETLSPRKRGFTPLTRERPGTGALFLGPEIDRRGFLCYTELLKFPGCAPVPIERGHCREQAKMWGFLSVLGVAVFAVWYIRASAFGPNTFGPGEELKYLNECFGQEITVLKTAQAGRVKALLCADGGGRTPGDGFVVVFKRRLLGLRWEQTGMNHFSGEGLFHAESWENGSRTRCNVEVYGDNRAGALEAYAFADAPEIRREALEADYILDIYLPDGIDSLPQTLQTHPSP